MERGVWEGIVEKLYSFRLDYLAASASVDSRVNVNTCVSDVGNSFAAF